MFAPSARVLADSVSEAGDRLTTMEVTGHRFILAEFNTHRAFSRNSASSRAIPYPKMRQKVIDQLAYPVAWPAEQKGMQGGEDIDNRLDAMLYWKDAALSALEHADKLVELGLHKSVVNRLLEPFLPHTIIVSATDWQGFWDQRCHPDAQPEIKALADAMREAYDKSMPREVLPGGWHLPLIQWDELLLGVNTLKKLSVARSARVSYLTHDGIRDRDKDLELYERLRHHLPAHASPFEHVATPQPGRKVNDFPDYLKRNPGNFTGWLQLRHIEGLG